MTIVARSDSNDDGNNDDYYDGDGDNSDLVAF